MIISNRHSINKLRLKSILCGLLITFFVFSCVTGNQISYKPTSAGKADEVLWVMNDRLWQDSIGQIANNTFMSAYEVLPQAEPEYFVRKKNFQQFNNDIIKKYRTIIICVSKADDPQYKEIENLLAASAVDSSKSIVILNDVWASPQIVVIIKGDDKDELASILNNNVEEILADIRDAEDERINYLLFQNELNEEAIKLMKKKFNYEIDIPEDYYIAVKNKDFVWLRKETGVLSSNFMLYKRELKPSEINNGVDWNKFAIQVRLYLGQTYISTRAENSFMVNETKYAPTLQNEFTILGQNAVETKGLWKMENDFMGGPYRNIAWFDKESATYYMIDAFVHAPKEGKKKYMRHINSMLKTIRIPENKK